MALYDYPVSDEMKAKGFSRVYKKDKNLVIYNSPVFITSRYFSGDLQSTLHHLEKALVNYDKRNNNHFGNEKIERFLRWFAELDIKIDGAQEDAAKEVQNQETIHKERILGEINELKAVNVGISSEEWRTGLVNRFTKLEQTVQTNIPQLWPGLEFELSCMRILNLFGCTLPIIAIILGRAAGGKMQVISLLRKWPFAYYTDTHSAKSWVTHTTSVNTPEDLEKIDMLPRVKNRIFCTPEWAPIFTLREDDLRATLGIITRIADGQGLASNSGVYGRRAYEGIHMFAWIGAAVDVPHIVYKVLGTLGQKLYFFRLPFREITVDEVNRNLGSHFNTKFDSIQNALFDYLKWFEIGPDLVHDDTDGETQNNKASRLLKMKWAEDKDEPQVRKCISELSVLLSFLRCDVQTWTGGSDIGYSPSLPEDPGRAGEILFNLAKGHALLYGRNFITMEDIPVVVKTVLSTAQIDRVKILSLLLTNGQNWLSTSRVIESFSISPQTARRRMREFIVIGLADEEKAGSRHEMAIKLKPKFSWFLGEEFKQICERFKPADYPEYMEQNGNDDNDNIASEVADQESPTHKAYSKAYERMVVFDKVFDKLARESESSAKMQEDKDTIGRHELQKMLVATGLFKEADALAMIDEMLRIKKIKIVMLNTYRINDSRNSEEDVLI
jgi:hypothetical protein